jgi:DNA-directed RNA polymerase subunit RPC12/RpoP
MLNLSCPNCRSSDIEYLDDPEGVSTSYFCEKCGQIFDWDELIKEEEGKGFL